MTGPTLVTEAVRARVDAVIIRPDVSIQAALEPMDRTGFGVLLLAGADRQLMGVLTDGDVRRAVLRKQPLTDPCIAIATQNPVTVPPDITHTEALRVMQERRVNHLPVVDSQEQLVGLVLRTDLVDGEALAVAAVVMAGGFGTRLQALTTDTPKPLLPLGGRPIMAHLVEDLRLAGIRRVNITTHHQGDKIKEYFGDGSSFGMQFSYVSEDRPLGTAGALGLMETAKEPLLVVNGDILTSVNFQAMLQFHREHDADLTIGVRHYDHDVPYGVVECDGVNVQRLNEKPRVSYLVNAGIYLLEPSVQRRITPGQRFDMTDVIENLLRDGRAVVSFPIMEYWLDLGQPADYERAQRDIQDGRVKR